MISAFVKMMNSEGNSSPNCREARRRRIEMIRMTSATGGPSPSAVSTGDPNRKREADASASNTLPSATDKRSRPDGSDPPPLGSSSSSPGDEGRDGGGGSPGSNSASGSDPDPIENPGLGFGSVALSGRCREMEDMVSLHPAFFRPAGRPPLNFFAVFDGHGGSHVSRLCKERMHVLMAEELAALPPAADIGDEQVNEAVRRCFWRMDQVALSLCACGRVGGPPCACDLSGLKSEIVGSTAVVALVGPGRILVANCGDSRAVLGRGRIMLPMSIDHKPDRPDELARIQAAGGRVIYQNGARVAGILAMSRAIGDKYFKPVVICDPEITSMDRAPEDKCLILASDGLWDVLSNELACDVVQRSLEEAGAAVNGGGHEHPYRARCNQAAALLARLALGRKSTDNISVIVVDLRSG